MTDTPLRRESQKGTKVKDSSAIAKTDTLSTMGQCVPDTGQWSDNGMTKRRTLVVVLNKIVFGTKDCPPLQISISQAKFRPRTKNNGHMIYLAHIQVGVPSSA